LPDSVQFAKSHFNLRPSSVVLNDGAKIDIIFYQPIGLVGLFYEIIGYFSLTDSCRFQPEKAEGLKDFWRWCKPSLIYATKA